MDLLLARKGIHYYTREDEYGNQLEYAFTDKMLENDLYIEFGEFTNEVNVFIDNEEDNDVAYDEEADDNDGLEEGTRQVYLETTVHVMALINKQGVHYTIMVQPHISRMVIYGIIINLVDILENCPVDQYPDYLEQASTGNLSAIEIKHINPKVNPTKDIRNTIKLLKDFLKTNKMK